MRKKATLQWSQNRSKIDQKSIRILIDFGTIEVCFFLSWNVRAWCQTWPLKALPGTPPLAPSFFVCWFVSWFVFRWVWVHFHAFSTICRVHRFLFANFQASSKILPHSSHCSLTGSLLQTMILHSFFSGTFLDTIYGAQKGHKSTIRSQLCSCPWYTRFPFPFQARFIYCLFLASFFGSFFDIHFGRFWSRFWGPFWYFWASTSIPEGIQKTLQKNNRKTIEIGRFGALKNRVF